MSRGEEWDGDLLDANIPSSMQDDSLILNAINMSQTQGSKSRLILMSLTTIMSRTGIPLTIASRMPFIDGLLVSGDLVTLEYVILHGLNFSANLCLDIRLETKATVCDAKLGLFSVDGLPLTCICKEDPLGGALGAVLDAVLLAG